MKRTLTQRLFSIFASTSIILQSIYPGVTFLAKPAFAHDASQSATDSTTATTTDSTAAPATTTDTSNSQTATPPADTTTPTINTTPATNSGTVITPDDATSSATVATNSATVEATPEAQPSTNADSTTTPTGDTVNTTTNSTPASQPAVAGDSTVQTQNSTIHGDLSATVVKNAKAASLDLNLDSQTSGSANVFTNKADYAPTDNVIITGSNFIPSQTYIVDISSTDPPALSFSAPIKTDSTGSFIYVYQLDGNYRPNYKVEIKNSGGILIATTTFTDSNSPVISVTVTGTGTGTVTSADSFINCSSGTCTHTYGANFSTTLTAVAGAGSTFAGWSGSGGCTGTGTCGASANGNNTFFATATFNLQDNTAPTTTNNIDGNWHNSNVTVTLTCTDNAGGSGCANTYHTSDGSTPTTSSSITNPFTISADGIYTIKYFSKDVAGNSESVKTASNQVKIDKTNPVNSSDIHSTDHTINMASTNSTITMAWTIAGTAPGATDIGGSGIAGYSQSFTHVASSDPGTTTNLGSGATGVNSGILADGNWYFHLRTVDAAGNWSSPAHYGPYIIDTTSDFTATKTNNVSGLIATGSSFIWKIHVINSGFNKSVFNRNQVILHDDLPTTATYGTVSINKSGLAGTGDVSCSIVSNVLTCVATGATGADKVEIPNGSYFDASFTVTPSGLGTLSNPAASGVCAVDPDNHINESNETNNNCSDSVSVVDNVAPTTTDNVDGDWHNANITVTLTCTDNVGGSGCANTYHTTDGSDPTTSSLTGSSFTLNSDGIYTIKYFSKDVAGNSESVKTAANTVKIDKTSPSTPASSPVAGDYLSSQSVSLTSSDSLSGVAAIYYTVDGSTPDNTKTLYSSSITINNDATIKAIAYDNAGNASEILTATYGIAPVLSLESSTATVASSTIITWTTNISATSRVIYDTISHSVLGVAPNYGYANSTIEDATKVTPHAVSVTGLLAGTTYYYRVISHGSPEAVSGEQSFTTSAPTSNSSGISNGVSNNNNSSAPICNDTKPGSAPTLTKAVAGANSVTLFWTTALDPVTYYLVTYGVSSGSQTYGNPNVGGSGATSYMVNGLSGGTTYYFRVRSGNGCTPGDFSNELAATPTGGFIAGPAGGFSPGVLRAASSSGNLASESGVLGTESGTRGVLPTPSHPWWENDWLVFLILIFGFSLGFLIRRRFFQNPS